MGTTIQRTPVSLTTSACSRNLGSAELIAVSVTIVLIASRLMIRRSGPGRCQAPRTTCPGTTTCTRFSNQMSRRETSKIPEPRPKASTKPKIRPRANLRFTRRTFLRMPGFPIGGYDLRATRPQTIRSACFSPTTAQPDDTSGIRALTHLATRLNQAGQIVATRPVQATPTGWSGEFGELVNSSGPRPRLRNLREMNVLTTIRPSQPQVESGPSRRFEGRSFPGRLSPRTTPSRTQA